jgi:hypothetical protein
LHSLKYLLGHSTLVMVERHLHLTAADASNAHRRASPANNWRLLKQTWSIWAKKYE